MYLARSQQEGHQGFFKVCCLDFETLVIELLPVKIS